MLESDLDEVLRIERLSFASPWRREHFRHEIHENRHAVNLVVRERGELVAYASTWMLGDELTINNVAVAPGSRGRGFARRLLLLLIERASRRGCTRALLDVRASNAAALHLYHGLGFAEIGRRARYYRAEGEDAIVMARSLGPGFDPRETRGL